MIKVNILRIISLSMIFFLITSACCSNENAPTIQLPNIDRTTIFEKLEAYQLSNGGFNLPPDIWPASEYNTFFAQKYFELTARKAPITPSPYILSDYEEQLQKSSSFTSLYLLSFCIKDIIHNNLSLIKTLENNQVLNDVLHFSADENYGIILNAVELCEEFDIDYDRDLLTARWNYDLTKRKSLGYIDRYSDLYVASKLNSSYNFHLPIREEITNNFKDYETELKNSYIAGTLPLYAIYEYTTISHIYGLPMSISLVELADWLHHYKTSEGMFDQFLKNSVSDENATNMVCDLYITYSLPIDINFELIDQYYYAREQSTGWYADIDKFTQSDIEESYYAFQLLTLIDPQKSNNLIQPFLKNHSSTENDSVYYDLMPFTKYTPTENDHNTRINKLCTTLPTTSHSYLYAKILQEIHYELDLLEKLDLELSSKSVHIIAEAITLENTNATTFSCNYLRKLLLFRLGMSSDVSFENIILELKEMAKNKSLSSDDLFVLMYVCNINDTVKNLLLSDRECLSLISSFFCNTQQEIGFFTRKESSSYITSFKPTYTALLFANLMTE